MKTVKKSYTSLAVTIDTRSEEQVQADEEASRARKARFASMLGMIYSVLPNNPFGGLPIGTLTNDSRIHKGSAFKAKRSCRRRK